MKKLSSIPFIALAASLANAAELPTGWLEIPQHNPPPSPTAPPPFWYANGPTGAVYAVTGNIANGLIIASHGGQPGNDQSPWRMFDGVSAGGGSDKWCADPNVNGQWVVYQFANRDKWAVTNYHLRTANTLNRTPAVWSLEGSNDLAGNDAAAVAAASWVVVDARDQLLSASAWFSFDCADNQTAYNAYRLVIPSLYGGAGWHTELAQWQMFGNSGAAQIQLDAATNLTHFTADLAGYFEKHAADAFDFWLLCDTVDRGADLAAWQVVGAATKAAEPSLAAFTNTVRGLTPNVLHYARVCAKSETAEAWSGVVSFTPFSAAIPAVRSLAATDITEDGATANGELLYVPGGGTADIRLRWGEDPGNWAHDDAVGSFAAGASFDFPLSGLTPGVTYYYLFTAQKDAAFAESPEAVSVTPTGAPLLGAPRASVFSDAARVKAGLLSAGSSAARVSLWAGADAASLAFVEEWPATTTAKEYDA
ncbi:MAG: hypothetical protein FWF96_07510, partial [Kiritimatiellaeota bacterium]|nr:hypothetical protein [Kiritimatiellota bacterium]